MEKENKYSISVVIIAKNEERMIGVCIESAKRIHPKEILVIDDGSVDNTISVSKQHGGTVMRFKKKDFAEIRNFAQHMTRSKWIFYLDADERLTLELAEEIRRELKNPQADVYSVKRINFYLGREWPYRERIIRLFRKDALMSWEGVLHESPKYKGIVKPLEGTILHDTHKTLHDMVENTLDWSGIEANLRFEAHHPPVVWWRFPRVMIPVFWDYYVNQGGWKVGTVGLIESMYQSFSICITYARLWELQNQNKSKDNTL